MKRFAPSLCIVALSLLVAGTASAQEGEPTERSGSVRGTEASTGSASPDAIPLTVYVEVREQGTTRVSGSGGRNKPTGMLSFEPIRTATYWNAALWVEEDRGFDGFAYGFSFLTPSRIIGGEDRPYDGFGLGFHLIGFFNGTTFYGPSLEVSLQLMGFTTKEDDEDDPDWEEPTETGGVFMEISGGYSLDLGGPFVANLSAGLDIILDAGSGTPAATHLTIGDSFALTAGAGIGIAF